MFLLLSKTKNADNMQTEAYCKLGHAMYPSFHRALWKEDNLAGWTVHTRGLSDR